jgi:hypothetical protein
MTCDEIVVVERMNKSSVGSGKRSVFERLPRNIVWNRNEFRPERPHPFKLGFRCCFNHHHRAWHTCLSRRVRYALTGISRANCPHTAATFFLGQ